MQAEITYVMNNLTAIINKEKRFEANDLVDNFNRAQRILTEPFSKEFNNLFSYTKMEIDS
jgi:hypothetical protein